jgi:hypothetical protein
MGGHKAGDVATALVVESLQWSKANNASYAEAEAAAVELV